MSIVSATDHAIFTDADVFGEAVSYTPAATGVPVAIAAIWRAEHSVLLEGDAGIGVAAAPPVASVFRDALPAEPAAGDTILRAGTIWRVAEVRPDGTGLFRLLMEID